MDPALERRRRAGLRRLARRVLAALVVVAAGAAALMSAPRESAYALLREGSVVESASALLYLVGAAAVVVGGRSRTHLAAALLLLTAGLRELDFHDRFTSRAVSQLRFYTSAQTPWVERVVVVVLLVLLIAATVRVGRAALARLRGGEVPFPSAFAGLTLLVLALPMDRLVRLLVFEAGRDADAALPFLLFSAEELMELAGAALLAAAAWRAVAGGRETGTPVAAGRGHR